MFGRFVAILLQRKVIFVTSFVCSYTSVPSGNGFYMMERICSQGEQILTL